MLVRIGKPAVEPLLARLHDPRPKYVQELAWVLGQIGDPRAVESLVRLLSSKNLWERWVAASSLGYIGDERATPALIERLRDHSTTVRFAVVGALGDCGDSTAI
jgi:HEAT repeat protein